MNRPLKLAPIADLSLYLTGQHHLIGAAGPDGQLYLAIYKRREANRLYSAESDTSYRVLALYEGQVTLDRVFPDLPYGLNFLQPLPGDELLFVYSRTRYRGPEDFETNGYIMALFGRLQREIFLGDGIEDMQTTSSGRIWTSYFDEGVYGSATQNIGASGVVAWDSDGQAVYTFEPGGGMDVIDDCYALNVASDSDTWFCYYSEFNLVHLKNERIVAFWPMPLYGSNAFAVDGNFAFFSGGYDEENTYHLFDLGNSDKAQEVATFDLYDESGVILSPERVVGRGSALYLFEGQKIYCLDVTTVLEACH